jgi:acyl-CoA synthetase (AMP-forming)/AMP-acid ligase II
MTGRPCEAGVDQAGAGYRDFDGMMRQATRARADQPALADARRSVTWGELDLAVNRIANALIARGIAPDDRVAVLGRNSVDYAVLMLGILRAGACVVPLPTMAAGEALAGMTSDSDAKLFFVSRDYAGLIAPHKEELTGLLPGGLMLLDVTESEGGRITLGEFMSGAPATPPDMTYRPDMYFNLIYSSGTTGAPKGIMQDRRFRSQISVEIANRYGVDQRSRVLVATPLYSNTTLFLFIAVMAAGGSALLMEKFDARRFLELSERQRTTHVVLVPVQFTRLLAEPGFDGFDLSSYVAKFTTSAPLQASAKREILDRWPAGGLTEFYGMTEGGVGSVLEAHQNPDKLDTVGKVGQLGKDGDVRVIGEDGRELPQGAAGELVGWAPLMMVGYHNRPDATAEASWYDESGRRFHRSGDIGWIDGDGFLHLLDRKKDMIISGGFNIFAVDLENALLADDEVADAAVVGAPSAEWGETPVAFVVPKASAGFDAEAVRGRANARLGKAQRIARICTVEELPRNSLGKVLKRELRSRLAE